MVTPLLRIVGVRAPPRSSSPRHDDEDSDMWMELAIAPLCRSVALPTLLSIGVAAGQQHAQQHRHDHATGDANTAANRATHAPQPELAPLFAWRHVMLGNAAFVAARKHGEPAPRPAPRPAGAGRYVCAVVACADIDFAIAERLGLAQRDLLEIRVPGPFITPEVVALLDRAVQRDRVALVLLLTHDRCDTLALPHSQQRTDALTRRVATARQLAKRHGRPLAPTLLRRQRELLLVASSVMRAKRNGDKLRVMLGELQRDSGKLVWHHQRADELPIAPVK